MLLTGVCNQLSGLMFKISYVVFCTACFEKIPPVVTPLRLIIFLALDL